MSTSTIQQYLVAYARQIAVVRGYTNLENGLQPANILREKRGHEIGELKQALTDPRKSWRHWLHEVADVLYYSACLDAQCGSDWYQDTLRECLQFLRVHGLQASASQVEQVALAKYQYRASDPQSKNEAEELRLVESAYRSRKPRS